MAAASPQRDRRGDGPAPSLQRIRSHRPACYECFRPTVACICASVARVVNQTSIIILQHPRERLHAVGTARIARLGLAQVRVQPFTQWEDGSAIRAQLPEQTALLYPAAAARDLSMLPADQRPRHLLVIDGTWFHARKIYAAHRWLRDLPSVSLTPTAPSRYRIRREPQARYVATIEAIVAALRILEPQTRGLDGLVRCFAAMVDRQATYTPVRQAAAG
jgi:hypothetical protein